MAIVAAVFGNGWCSSSADISHCFCAKENDWGYSNLATLEVGREGERRGCTECGGIGCYVLVR